MLSIIPGHKVAELDRDYIMGEGITSLQLMERAALAFYNWFTGKIANRGQKVFIFCGPGNNGGDGLAVARLLHHAGYTVSVIHGGTPDQYSSDFQANFLNLPKEITIFEFETFHFDIHADDCVIDGIFGVGINRPLSGQYLDLIRRLNTFSSTKIAIDIPSGLPSDKNLDGEVFQADYTITFQFPKLSLLFPEHVAFVGEIAVLDIGIPDDFMASYAEDKFYLQQADIPKKHKRFHRFSHKGDFGRILLVGGSTGKVGAILLASKAALRTGSGLVFCHLPEGEGLVAQITVPEVMVANDADLENLNRYDAIGMGPGWGLNVDTVFFEKLLKTFSKPVVIDADGLNLISSQPKLLDLLPEGSILTPHLVEFERLAGKCNNHLERIGKARDFAVKYNCVLVLKGANTVISMPGGKQIFNSTGNQYMATAGAGDVLTGMITSFLGQGYAPENAAICGVFHHGLAGEIASESKKRGLIASDIIAKIPSTFTALGVL